MFDVVNFGYVIVDVDVRGVVIIEFGYFFSNLFFGKILWKLVEMIIEISVCEDVKIIFLCFVGSKVFCVGVSFDELIVIFDIEIGKIFFFGFVMVINVCRKVFKLIIGCV